VVANCILLSLMAAACGKLLSLIASGEIRVYKIIYNEEGRRDSDGNL